MRLRYLDAIIVLLALTTLAEWLAQTTRDWTWDVNHMLYFGQRILAGEFHWTAEFDDKLPILNILFALPASFDSIAAWRAMSLSLLVSGAGAVALIVNALLRESTTIPRADRLRYALLGGLSSLYFATFFPGDIDHINAPAAAFAAISLAALLRATRKVDGPRLRGALVALSAASASVAIGMRPYFLLALIVGALWLQTRGAADRKALLQGLWGAVRWTVWVGLFGLLANALPYVLLGRVDAFLAGMSLLRQPLVPHSVFDVVIDLLRALTQADGVALCMVIAAGAACVHAARLIRGRQRPEFFTRRLLFADTLVLSLLLPALVALAILGRHFWPHYLQLFGPFFAIGFAMALAFAHDFWRSPRTGPSILPAVALSLAAVLVLPNVLLDLARSQRAPESAQLDQTVATVAQIRDAQPEGRRDFLFVDNMYTHWKLAEPRHGFPHAANTLFIQNGWWERVEMPAHFGHPTTVAAYCAQIEQAGPSLVILGARVPDLRATCFGDDSVYRLLRAVPELDLTVFVREPAAS